MNQLQNLLGFVVGFLVGMVPAFLINFNSVFSDKNGSLNELLFTFVLIVVSYGVIGLAFGFLGKKSPLAWGRTISSPAFVILVLYAFGEPKSIAQSFVNICLTFASVWIGSSIGIRLNPKNK